MNRRTFLTASVTTLAAPFAGCLSDSNENSDATTSVDILSALKG
ncbi:quinoprotein glucose dehydrogenase (plasmid) [Natrialba magadii ATCC 43099]|uniref:Quinoprotein glucose dehydrogenase n=1 Tax=Natrialba magadii (strain ATCC 43099 / DSM 3394 / CCM 3739 / CIP 104546 / IAM 13178 / JCM 8861 / NBRC 102185 / NCIMB 2190 / MS3) TaxID=547559 RepID=D3T1T2_NATMM|nr:quinoprotein glucose dehydrogenase [Natrialba magadii ATCC 43099]